MSTFTVRFGVHRCDRCRLRTGTTWRAKRDHECPTGFRAAVTPLSVKTCEYSPCQEPIEQRADESPWAFGKRRFCDRTCSRRATVAKGKAA